MWSHFDLNCSSCTCAYDSFVLSLAGTEWLGSTADIAMYSVTPRVNGMLGCFPMSWEYVAHHLYRVGFKRTSTVTRNKSQFSRFYCRLLRAIRIALFGSSSLEALLRPELYKPRNELEPVHGCTGFVSILHRLLHPSRCMLSGAAGYAYTCTSLYGYMVIKARHYMCRLFASFRHSQPGTLA